MKYRYVTVLLFILGFNQFLSAQGSVLDKYSHFIVPLKYNFQDEDNEYQLNSLVKHTFKQEGFTAFISEENLPLEYLGKGCDALVVDLVTDKTVFTTYVTIQLKDCNRKIVFESKVGESREKFHRKAHQEAFLDAFTSIEDESLKTLFANRNQSKNQESSKKLTKEEQKIQVAEVIKAQSDKLRYAGTTYLIFNRDGNFELYDESGFKKLADIKKADGKTFLFHSEEINGVANFDENGNLVVQYMDEVLNQVESFTYKKID
ncbi:MAG: hypothetical protein LAT51_12755 [Flavobacteriaceae bacterium]|nr:hypothetical protein [Flavobacteriaceae bacterium]